ncbi:hypothetical protein D1007_12809 [Hordeum vulgare]|nr:hypothetical protein D1007_12809 [Hordeum vulgare]
MEVKTKLDEAVPDVEHQLLPPASIGHKPTGCPCSCELARAPSATASTSPATAARTLALVTATAGLAFAVDLGARGEHAALAVFAAGFMVLCASSSLLAWCAGRKAEQGRARAWPETAAARVPLWSFAVALVVCMTSWVSLRVPWAAGSALSTLGLLVGSLCFAEMLPCRFVSSKE